MTTLTHSTRLVIETCWCGIGHAIPADLARMAAENGTAVYCPLGHRWVVKQTEAARLREEKQLLERRLSAERDTSRRLRENVDAERRRSAALKGHLTRAKKRIANGVCPVPGCKRSGFERVMAHIASQHPDWLHDHPEVAEVDAHPDRTEGEP